MTPEPPDRGEPLRALRGIHDVLYPQSARWESLIATFAQLASQAGYRLLVSPLLEDASVFRRGIGSGSQVVGKEMYEFSDRDGTMVALRPEGTASVARAFVQHHLRAPWKVWYVTSAFRHERPQAGRYREHHQLGVEALGPQDPDLDVEVIWLAHRLLTEVGTDRLSLSVNSIGDARCRPGYLASLRGYLGPLMGELCKDHAGRVEVNPLRVLDCKRPECMSVTAEAPRFTDHLCPECSEHFERVLEGLEALSIQARFEPRLVRGLDYYTRTTFEFASSAMEAAQNGVGGGGRYDGLVEAMGGPPTPGVGFGLGVERVLLARGPSGADDTVVGVDAYLIDLGDGSSARDLCAKLRLAGISCDRAFGERSLKASMRTADRLGAMSAVIIGDQERARGTVSVRPLRGGEQTEVALGELSGVLASMRDSTR
ncbi:MAG: histidine--tRNA ligase [Acidimicrobiales bacterium]